MVWSLFALPGATKVLEPAIYLAATCEVVPYYWWKLLSFDIHIQDIVLSAIEAGSGVQLMQDPIIEFIAAPTSSQAKPVLSMEHYSLMPQHEFMGDIIQTTNGGAVSFHTEVNSDWTSYEAGSNSTSGYNAGFSVNAVRYYDQPSISTTPNQLKFTALSLLDFLTSNIRLPLTRFPDCGNGVQWGGRNQADWIPATYLVKLRNMVPTTGNPTFQINLSNNPFIKYTFKLKNRNRVFLSKGKIFAIRQKFVDCWVSQCSIVTGKQIGRAHV